jgi:hypothetical protein
MTVCPGRTIEDAFAEGCLFAASAKLIRGLRGILVGWRDAAAAEDNGAPATEAVQQELPAVPFFGELDEIMNIDSDELFGQRSSWPNPADMDFSQFLPE